MQIEIMQTPNKIWILSFLRQRKQEYCLQTKVYKGLIAAGLAKYEKDAAKNLLLMAEAQQKVGIAKSC